MRQVYLIGDENWEYMEENGFLGIPVYGGIAFRKPGYKTMFFEHEAKAAITIEDSELDLLVSNLRGSAE